jgi:hypothetical protein
MFAQRVSGIVLFLIDLSNAHRAVIAVAQPVARVRPHRSRRVTHSGHGQFSRSGLFSDTYFRIGLHYLGLVRYSLGEG